MSTDSPDEVSYDIEVVEIEEISKFPPMSVTTRWGSRGTSWPSPTSKLGKKVLGEQYGHSEELVMLLRSDPQFRMDLSGRFADLCGQPPQSRHA
ncbi:hypothetical protein [Streptomyces sp. NPDC048584]|uniref:hypothetical protein n=1 Tax=Streptomyces sp. NPDC048584 TaxID=3365573 RepID=UPI003722E43D